tara:strand:+ start:72174 stop:73538 length:1365 start_codon:yes stop_codon:yes gene_type:complete
MSAYIKSILSDKEILTKGFYSLILKILGSLFGYFLLWLVTNEFSEHNEGTSAWGEYVLFLAFLNVSSIFSRLGIDKLSLKLVAAADQELRIVRHIYFSLLRLVVIVSIIVSFIIYLFSNYIVSILLSSSDMGLEIVLMIVFVLPFFSVICLNENTLRGLKMIKEFAFFQRTSKMLFSVLVFILLFYVFNFTDTIVVIYAYTLALFLIFILSSFRVYSVFSKAKSQNIDSLDSKGVFKQSLPMMLSSSVLLLMSWTDSLMLGFYSDESSVGIYNVTVKVALLATLTISAINSIVAPRISETFNNNRIQEFKTIIFNSTSIIFFSTLPILILIFLFHTEILDFFGNGFSTESAISALLILTFSQFVNAVSGPVGTILNMTGKQKVYGNILLVALTLNIFLNFLLVPENNPFAKFGINGINGAAIASASSLIFWNIYSVVYVYRKYNVLTFIKFKNL